MAEPTPEMIERARDLWNKTYVPIATRQHHETVVAMLANFAQSEIARIDANVPANETEIAALLREHANIDYMISPINAAKLIAPIIARVRQEAMEEAFNLANEVMALQFREGDIRPIIGTTNFNALMARAERIRLLKAS